MASFLVPLLIIGAIAASLMFALRALKNKVSNPSASNEPGSSTFENICLLVRVPRESTDKKELISAPLAAEQMFASLHGLLRITPEIQEHISFEVFSFGDGFPEMERGIYFFVAVPRSVRDFVEGQIYAQYPGAQIQEAEDPFSKIGSAGQLVGTYIATEKEDYLPIRTFRDFEVDPLSAVSGAMSKISPHGAVWLQYLLCPLADGWQEGGHKYVEVVRGDVPKKSGLDLGSMISGVVGGMVDIATSIPNEIINPGQAVLQAGKPEPRAPLPPKLSSGKELALKALENKLTKMGFSTIIRAGAVAETQGKALDQLRSVTASFRQYSVSDLNGFSAGVPSGDSSFLEENKNRTFPKKHSFILSTEELASIFHFPSSAVETPAIAWAKARQGEPPLNLPIEDCTFLGKTTFRNQFVKFGIRDSDRAQHMYLIGKTGTGKTTIFKNMVVQDMRNGKGVGVLDPHGSLIDELLDFVPKERVNDVVIFDPSDVQRPVSLNMLECIDPAQKNLMASGLVDVFKKHFGFSWGPRLEYLLNICILTLLEMPNTTLLGITRLLSDDNYCNYITYRLKDPVLRDFWTKEYKQMKGNQKLITEAIAPIQNKVGRFLSSSTIRNILGQAKSSILIDEVMNGGKIFFVNLAKGRIGEDNANLLGSMIISRMSFMAMQRVDLPESQRKEFFLFVDEFQNFASGSFANILSEARKYRLCLHLTHQYTAQLPEEMMDAVFGNVGTIASFALGAPDAEMLAPEFAPYFNENDLISLERFNMYVKLMIDGMTSAPFSAISLTPPEDVSGTKDEVVARSREVYGHDVAVVEEKVKKWFEARFDLGMAIREAREAGELPPIGAEGGTVSEPPAATPPPATNEEDVSGEIEL